MNKLISEAHNLFQNCGFEYCICGGFALEMFAHKELRSHGDFDISIFEQSKEEAVIFLQNKGWNVYARFLVLDDASTHNVFYLIENAKDEKWEICVNMWAVKPDSWVEMVEESNGSGIYKPRAKKNVPRMQNLDFIELEINKRTQNALILPDSNGITVELDKAILYKNGIPYLAPEIVLFLKSAPFYSTNDYQKKKGQIDFKEIIPLLPKERCKWLFDAIDIAYPQGHGWLDGLL